MTQPGNRSGRSRYEAGFTMVETVIAITIVGAAMLTILAAATSGFGYQDMARQRQSAVGIANRVIEELRARPYAELVAGIAPIDPSNPPPHAKRCRKIWKLVDCSPVAGFAGASEPLRHSGSSNPLPPLNPSSDSLTLNGISFRWTAFVSQASPGKPLRLTAFVDWTWRGRPFSTSLQSLVWVPEGCISGPTQPVAGACPGGQSNIGTARSLTVSVDVVDTTVSKACGNVDSDATCTTAPATGWTWEAGRIEVGFEDGGGIQSVKGSVQVPGASQLLAKTAQADTDTTNGTPPSVGPFPLDSAEQNLWQSPQINFTNTSPSLSSSWSVTLRYPNDPDIQGSISAVATGTCAIGTIAPCAGGVLSNYLDGIRLAVTCSGSNCPSTSEIPLVDLYTKFDVPASAQDVYWDLTAKVDSAGGSPAMTLQRRIGEIRMGCVSLSGPTGCSWLGFLYNVQDGFTQSLAAGASTVTPSATAFKLNTLTNTATCVEAAVQAGVEETSSAARWTSATTRCFATAAAGGSGSWRNVVVFRFSGMTYTPSSPAPRSVIGPTFGFAVQIEKCTNNGCSQSDAYSPVFRVTVSIPGLTITPQGVEW